MTRDEALALLEDRAPRNRLRGARALQAQALPSDYQRLREHIDREPDAHVRRALVRVLHGVRPEQRKLEVATSQTAAESRKDLIEDVWSEATEEITGIFVHEISPLAGAVGDAAKSDLGVRYKGSATARALDRLRDLVELLAQLRRAASAPDATEFDLTDLVVQVIADEGLTTDGRVHPARDDPVVIVGAASAVRIALANGLRNAVDAVDERAQPEDGHVVINWGVTDKDAWISVLDNGVGLPEGSHRVFDFGLTTKPKSQHFGFGLSISIQAMQSAGGSLELTPRTDGGASLIIRWPLDAEAR